MNAKQLVDQAKISPAYFPSDSKVPCMILVPWNQPLPQSHGALHLLTNTAIILVVKGIGELVEAIVHYLVQQIKLFTKLKVPLLSFHKCFYNTDSFSVCSLPKKIGPCKGRILRYFYNNKNERCEKFFWGGCDPNLNNFEHIDDCSILCEPLHLTPYSKTTFKTRIQKSSSIPGVLQDSKTASKND